MNKDKLTNRMARLPEEDQDALARLTLLKITKRSRLERIARGAIWTKLGLFFPIVVAVALLGFRGSLADYMPVIIIFLLFIIQVAFASAHSRMDAINELMKLDQESHRVQSKQAETAPPNGP